MRGFGCVVKSKTCVVGVDIGTTSTKAIVYDTVGAVLSKYAVEYPLDTSQPSSAVQDPDEIFRAVITSVSNSVKTSGVRMEDIRCVSFSSAMHSVIAVDTFGTPITPCITWADSRGNTQTEEILAQGGHEVYRRTGTPIHPMSPLSKIRWIKQQLPDVFARTHKFISIKEYVFYKLFGTYVVDYSIASATGLLNIFTLDWDEEALQLAGITEHQLSSLKSTTFMMQGVDPTYGKQMGLPLELPFVLGAGDGVLANLGVYAMEKGVVAATIGTSGAVRTVVDKPLTDPKGRTFCYALTENHWVIGGAINNGGIVLQWVKDELGDKPNAEKEISDGDAYELLTEIAAEVKAGSEGLLFLPFLMGERAPYWNANARGVFFGLAMHHHRKHLIRAAFEGVIFQMYNVVLALEDLTEKFQEVRATGGFTRSPLVRQIMADVFGITVTVPDNYESSCWGAALLGLLATGDIPSLEDTKGFLKLTNTHTPDAANTVIYNELMSIYLRIYDSLKEEFDTIARFQTQ
jgi:gluconokinase